MRPYYQDDLVTLYHGDALEVLGDLPMVDAIVTDPPFSMPAQYYDGRTEWRRSWVSDTSILEYWWRNVTGEMLYRLRTTGSVFVFADDESYPVFYPVLYALLPRLNALVWDKGAIGMGSPWRHTFELVLAGRYPKSKWTGGNSTSDVLRAKSVHATERLHPVDKPVDLLSRLIEPTTDPGDTVLDPFVGGGSTLVAAKALGRKAIGIELEERWCEVAANRLRQDVLGLSA